MKEKRKASKLSIAIIAALVVLLAVLVPVFYGFGLSGQGETITKHKLQKAINISELSTAEFVYNGIVQVYEQDGSGRVRYNIRYNASVKVGIQMDKVDFEIDKDAKTIMPVLPEISINSITIDPSDIGFIPESASIDLKEAFSTCKNDVQEEASRTKELYDIAEENVKSTIEALLYPIVETSGYTIVWAE